MVLVAVLFDLKTYKIPNAINLLGFVISLTGCIYEKGYIATIWHMLIAIAVGVVLMPIFYFQVIGAGDVKLLIVLAIYLEPKQVLYCILYAFCIGAILGVLKMIYKKSFLKRFIYLGNYIKTCLSEGKCGEYFKDKLDYDATIHFSIAIFVGYIFVKLGGVDWVF